MKYLASIFIVLILLFTTHALEKVPELTELNFASTLESHFMVVVLFYTLAHNVDDNFQKRYQEFYNLALDYKRPYILTQINADSYPNIAAKYSVNKYPALKIFKNGTVISGDTQRPFDDIIKFLDRKAFAQVTPITVEEDLKRISEKKDMRSMRAFLISDNETLLEEYKNAALESTIDCIFFHAPVALGKQVFRGSWEAPVIFVINPFAKDQFAYPAENFDKASFETFLGEAEIPPMMRLNKEASDIILIGSMNKVGIILYRSVSEKSLDNDIEAARKQLKCKECFFTIADLSNPETADEKDLAFYLGISEMPTLVIVKSENQELKKWIYKGPINAQAISQFYSEWKAGKVPRSLKSEQPPKSNPGPVYAVVGSTFKEEVIDAPQDVLVVFHSRWCSTCGEAIGVMNELAGESQGRKESTLKCVTIEGTKNEIEGMHITGYPTIKLFLAGRKERPIDIEYNGREDLIEEIKKYHKSKEEKYKEDL